jgi:large conductance mechanosensitive channel
MLKGFREFVLRGNVIDLAVAVVIGAAFGSIVTALTDRIIKPLLNSITPPSSPGLGVQLVADKPSTYIDLAALITAALNFIVVAAVIYFGIVLPLRTLQQRRNRATESATSLPTDIELLTEIRDLLSTRLDGTGSGDRTPRG